MPPTPLPQRARDSRRIARPTIAVLGRSRRGRAFLTYRAAWRKQRRWRKRFHKPLSPSPPFTQRRQRPSKWRSMIVLLRLSGVPLPRLTSATLERL